MNCKPESEALAAKDPSLRVVSGWANLADGSMRWHFWCEDTVGQQWDPTEDQFDEHGGVLFRQEEEDKPRGRCMNCGATIYESVVHLMDGPCCSSGCSSEAAKEILSRRRGLE